MKPFLSSVLLPALLSITFSTAAMAEDAADQTAKNSDPLTGLLNQIGTYSREEAAQNKARETQFLSDLNTQKRLLSEARAALKREQQLADSLKERFDNNEQALTEREEELRLRVGNLGEMFGVVRQVANDLNTVLGDSLTSVEIPQRKADLNKLAEAKELPTIAELEALWFSLQQEMTINGAVTSFDSVVIGADGKPQKRSVTRLGVFNAVDDSGYLAYDAELKQLQMLGRQPGAADMIPEWLNANAAVAPFALDPSRGALLNLSLESPDLLERVQQGALVGYIIIGLGLIGLALAGWRLVVLGTVGRKVRQQLDNIDSAAEDNPLGRVLASYRNLPQPLDVDVLEAKMDEAVLRELPALERGQTIIKLFAGIAPLLGLLGTVTGMIATFQAITNFGTGDPKLMASGISQALITTVLGLLAAIPLLLAHNWVASRSKALIQLLDEQSAGLIAQALENRSGQNPKGN
ncbi:MotA/TolQ/ExbB proton channel family protein [Thalassolituus sp. ST750PaO-4]|uniref:MotA/TolQ/ExbB proton channel family protein n=1 Tax=Thalassolituus sp. ST750PaO-4 TaxID=2742965 RepID=UPI001CE2F327|nr:MotA/TolQ/ExbB proton channel family protein [Thalassolituus sp. ST750PaO-4]MCA6061055.1 MotA/TolQ/ExbB proton channel family protein [Thalassolituus sp. ST750PaO-4]